MNVPKHWNTWSYPWISIIIPIFISLYQPSVHEAWIDRNFEMTHICVRPSTTPYKLTPFPRLTPSHNSFNDNSKTPQFVLVQLSPQVVVFMHLRAPTKIRSIDFVEINITHLKMNQQKINSKNQNCIESSINFHFIHLPCSDKSTIEFPIGLINICW